jgi:hypothetical protein
MNSVLTLAKQIVKKERRVKRTEQQLFDRRINAENRAATKAIVAIKKVLSPINGKRIRRGKLIIKFHKLDNLRYLHAEVATIYLNKEWLLSVDYTGWDETDSRDENNNKYKVSGAVINYDRSKSYVKLSVYSDDLKSQLNELRKVFAQILADVLR